MADVRNAQALAEGLREIYRRFLQDLEESFQRTQRKSFGKKVASGAMEWIGGSYIKTERQMLSLKFQKEVQDQLIRMEEALRMEDEEAQAAALETAVDILTEPVDPKSNQTADLMRRAMILEAKPYLSRISEAKRRKIRTRLERSYARNEWLPVEEEIMTELYRLSLDKAKEMEETI